VGKPFKCVAAQVVGKSGQQTVACFQQHHAGLSRVQGWKVFGERLADKFGQRSCVFHPRGAAAHHGVCENTVLSVRIAFVCGLFEA
jgi:hypothetical protein